MTLFDDDPIPAEPVLTDAIVADPDESELATVIDERIRREPLAARRLQEIVMLRSILATMVEADVSAYILDLDELVEQRWRDVSVELVRWAFVAGQASLKVRS